MDKHLPYLSASETKTIKLSVENVWPRFLTTVPGNRCQLCLNYHNMDQNTLNLTDQSVKGMEVQINKPFKLQRIQKKQQNIKLQ